MAITMRRARFRLEERAYTWLERILPRSVEPIELCVQRYGFLPACFRQRGELHHIRQIRAIRERQRRGARTPRRYFTVACADGHTRTIYQDLQLGSWYIVR